MQWNTLDVVRPSALLAGLPDPAWVYFVHSYAPDDVEHAVATCDYGGAVLAPGPRANLAAPPFPPGHSGAVRPRAPPAVAPPCRPGVRSAAPPSRRYPPAS